jgi:uracil-DNA glycosylase
VTSRADAPPAVAHALARYLRQRQEMGGRALFLESGPAEGLLAAARQAPRFEAAPRAASGRAPSPGDAPHPAPSGMAAPPPSREGSGTGASGARQGAGVVRAGADGPLPDTLEGLATRCSGCTLCGLSETRQHVVFADGSPEARVMVVGEAPGANEDATGLPFVGAAGKLLDLLLLSVGLSRASSVYICNVIKCRPPGNRNPTAVEIERCAPYLRRQIELVQPEVILAVGTFAGKLLSGEDTTLGALRGRVHRYHDTPLVVTYHPAALLRNPGWSRPTWEDLQLLRHVLAGSAEAS